MTATEVLVALVIAVGLVGILVPILPGSVLVAAGDPGLGRRRRRHDGLDGLRRRHRAARRRRGREVRRPRPAAPGRRDPGLDPVVRRRCSAWSASSWSRSSGCSSASCSAIYLAELRRVGAAEAWPSTVHSLKAVGLSIVIELVAALAATWVWIAGVVAT